MKPLVSISCITYNHEDYIVDAIEGFLMQKTNFDFEILIHDDASTDRTAQIIRDYQKRYPEIIKPILQTENQYSKGVKRISYIYNHNRSKGKYIALCEGDDYWTDEYKLQKQVDYMEQNQDCSMCFHAAKIVNSNKTDTGKVIRMFNKDTILPSNKLFYGAGKTNATASIIYRKELLDNPPEWYFKSPVGDTPLALILSTKGHVFFMDRFMSSYRVGVPISFNSRVLAVEYKRINLRKELIDMLEQFNEYSNNIFDEEIKNIILYFKVLIIKDRDKLQGIKLMKNSIYRQYIIQLKGVKRLKTILSDMFPHFYNDIAKLKYLVIR
jgi:glycosyltransferase involved in cell wall biosynthesis